MCAQFAVTSALVTCPGRPDVEEIWSSSNVGASGCALAPTSNHYACDFTPTPDGEGFHTVPNGTSCTASLSCLKNGTPLASASDVLTYDPSLVWNGSSCVVQTSGVDLTAGVTSPASATAGSAATFSATIANEGDASTGASFSNFIQVATQVSGGGTVTDLASITMSTLASGASAVTQTSYTFPSVGTYSMRACADKSSSGSAGVITEANEGNNCGEWTDITVDFQCPAGQYWVSGVTCAPCDNGGCSGTGGTPSNPYGGLTCNNGKSDVPTCTPPSGLLMLNPNSCVIAIGASTCSTVYATWKTGAVADPKLVDGNTQTVLSNLANNITSPGLQVWVAYPQTIFHIQDGGTILDSKTATAACANGSQWDGTTCAALSPIASLALSDNYTPSGTLTATCTNSNGYEIIRIENPEVVIASGAYGTNPINQTVTVSGNYRLICTNTFGGTTINSIPAVRSYTSTPPSPTISINASPSTVQKGANSVISWAVNFPIASCSLAAKAVCAGGVCSDEQQASQTTLNNTFATGRTDANDPNGPNRLITKAVNGTDLTPVVIKTQGQKTLKINNTTDFEITCTPASGPAIHNKVRVNVTSSVEG
jgi:hypothetical protein